MSLQRLLVLSPLAALLAVSLAVRVASDQSARRQAAQAASAPTPNGVQQPRAFDKSSAAQPQTAPIATAPMPGPPAAALSFILPDPLETLAANFGSADANSVASSLSFASSLSASSSSAKKSKGEKTKGETKRKNAPEEKLTWRKPEDWTPPLVYGPSLPLERIHVQKQAHQLLKDVETGRVTLLMSDRDGEQLRLLERHGVVEWPAPPSGVVVRSPRQRDVLEGTLEGADADSALPGSSGALLASRSELPRRFPTANPADDPEFDPCANPPAPALLRLLTTLAGRSTPAHPLEIMSLLRPPYRTGGYVHVGAANPHSMGLAVDISAYGGHAIRQSQPEECVTATLALLRDLPPGRYRLGMPKAPEGGWELPHELTVLLAQAGSPPAAATTGKTQPPETRLLEIHPLEPMPLEGRTKRAPQTAPLDPSAESSGAADTEMPTEMTGGAIAALYGLYASSAKPVWPFFPAPYTETIADAANGNEDSADVSTRPAARSTTSRSAATGSANAGANTGANSALKTAWKTVLRFQNEAYAPESALADSRLRKALEDARKRGANVVAMFPDGADHIHVDVRQNP